MEGWGQVLYTDVTLSLSVLLLDDQASKLAVNQNREKPTEKQDTPHTGTGQRHRAVFGDLPTVNAFSGQATHHK